ncbi:metal-dependent hydrolase [soil metagenome]
MSTERRVQFEYPPDITPVWTPRFPELSAAANGVSLLMPYVEPYVVTSVRSVLDELDPELRVTARAFIAQETQHHVQHRRFNALLIPQVPGLERVEGWMQRTYGWLARRRSSRFGLAFAAAFETVAFALARWTESHMRQLFDGADAQVTTLFLWHLAEEVEHKAVAFDVYQQIDGSRLRYLRAGAVAVVLLSWFTLFSTLTMLRAQRRLLHPVVWWRLIVWGTSLAFEVLPNLFVSAMPSHHPNDFADPSVLTNWLSYYDPETRTMPLWWTGTAA